MAGKSNSYPVVLINRTKKDITIPLNLEVKNAIKNEVQQDESDKPKKHHKEKLLLNTINLE